ncbi:MAG: NUDIX domain-containing protein [Acidimicrobiales bacterium]
MEPWPDEVATDAVLRVSARVLLVDEHDRLLLLRYADRGKYYWCPVGGGIEDGETIDQAARREVLEETGFAAPAELIDVGRRRLVATMFDQLTDIREHWFLARVPNAEVSRTGWTPLEHATISAYRWWAATELASTSDRLIPRDLAGLLAQLLLHGPPSSPIELGP